MGFIPRNICITNSWSIIAPINIETEVRSFSETESVWIIGHFRSQIKRFKYLNICFTLFTQVLYKDAEPSVKNNTIYVILAWIIRSNDSCRNNNILSAEISESGKSGFDIIQRSV
jgi:hypothetical protein